MTIKGYCQKIKKCLDEILFEPEDTTDSNIQYKDKKRCNQKTKKYISRTLAIQIANKEQNLRKSMYIEAKKKGYYYGLIEINDLYATLVMVMNRYAWFIKVIDGKYIEKKNTKYFKGNYTDDSNVCCLVLAETGEFFYLGTNFDTRNIRMVTDEEFLDFIHNVKQ